MAAQPSLLGAQHATDPELATLFQHWVLDEVNAAAPMDARLRWMVQLAALIACQAEDAYGVHLEQALAVQLSAVEAREVLYQSVPYVGMGKVFGFLRITREVFQRHGAPLPLPTQGTTTVQDRFEKGLSVQKHIFGERIEAAHAQAPQDQKHIQRFLSANCFGDYYTRNGLDLRTRELLTFALLASLGGCEPQVAAHVAGNLAFGNDRALLIATITQLLPYIGYPRTLNALRVINEGTAL
jgi:4-carboxymuconolactone decarboxylase